MSTFFGSFVTAFSAAIGQVVRGVAGLAVAWERRRIVGQLGTLDDHMLNDIGITRHDILSVLAEPLYRDPSEQLAQRAIDARRARRATAHAARDYAVEFDPAPSGRRAA